MAYITVLITASCVEEAEKLVDELLNKHIVACANIVPLVHSRFWWKGKLERCDEALILAKSVEENFDEIVRSVRKLHSYNVPEIIAVPILRGFEEYLKWIDESVGLRGR